jgi:hypothetical protein
VNLVDIRMTQPTGKSSKQRRPEQFAGERGVNEVTYPHQLAYLNGGGRAWCAISNDPAYELGTRERSALNKFLGEMAQCRGPAAWNIVHVGPGSGVEASTIITALGPDRIASYALVDVSPELLACSSRAVAKFQIPGLRSYEHDVSRPGLEEIANEVRLSSQAPILFVLAANGGILFDLSCLRHIRESMLPEDRGLITLEMYEPNREQEILNQYRLPSVLDLFCHLLPTPARRATQFETAYNHEHSLLEVHFRPDHDQRPAFAVHGSEPPQRVRVFAALRPTPQRFRAIMEAEGFEMERFEVFEAEHCCGVLYGAQAKGVQP